MSRASILLGILDESDTDRSDPVLKTSAMLGEKQWVKNVKTKYHPPKGTFTGSAKKAGGTLKAAGASKAKQRMNFYINRAGKNLSPERKAALRKSVGLKAKPG